MRTKIWVFPEHGGIIPGIAGTFPGNCKVTIDEDTNTVVKIESFNQIILPENQVVVETSPIQVEETITLDDEHMPEDTDS